MEIIKEEIREITWIKSKDSYVFEKTYIETIGFSKIVYLKIFNELNNINFTCEFDKINQRELEFISLMLKHDLDFPTAPYLYLCDENIIQISKICNDIFYLFINKNKYLISKQSILKMINFCVEIKNNENKFIYEFIEDTIDDYNGQLVCFKYNNIKKITNIKIFIPEVILKFIDLVKDNVKFEEQALAYSKIHNINNMGASICCKRNNQYFLTFNDLLHSTPDSSSEQIIVELTKLEILVFLKFLII